MKLITFTLKDAPSIYRIGAVKNDKIIDFYSSNLPNDMINFIKLGDEGSKQASQIINLSNDLYSFDEINIKALYQCQIKY